MANFSANRLFHLLRSVSSNLLISGAGQRTVLEPRSHGCRYVSAKMGRPRETDPHFDEVNINQYSKNDPVLSLRTYMWGNAQTGAVGVAEYPRPKINARKPPVLRKHHPIRLPFCELTRIRFKQVSCGYGFTLFLTSIPDMQNNSVYVTGLNTDSQLGFHPKMNKDRSMKTVLAPIPLDLPLRNRKAKVLQVAAGRAHSVILTEEGCFALGNNAYGQCGRKIVEKENYANNSRIHRVQDLPGDVIKIHCSQDTSYFLTASGQVYSCGWGADGQTGNGTYDTTSVPVRAVGDIAGERIVHLSSAADCVLALNDKGQVFGWGNSEYQQLSTVTREPQTPYPQYLPFDKELGQIKNVSAGGTVCGLINAQGQAFVWGFGLLGKGPEIQNADFPSPMPMGLFEAAEFDEKNPLKSIHCGMMHHAIISERGDLYTWGANDFGQLGLDHCGRDIQYHPLRVNISARVQQISLGVDHSGAICRANI
ncbi:RCC1-like G exchanging factor-like protein [Paramacrobiotus metropolitanus]|uniref:RCC1-like G exchanging factor-like protein n=1 Tax=Paramacrobiotus metropolitanus TaxID=2943436 RepID=UPI002445E330|nr:RCC1-like G exchanging factor-like protein [Paramacrobiotus metropolitanus]